MSLQQPVEVGAVVACESRCVRHIAVRFAQDADERAALEQCHALGEGHRFTIWKSVGCGRSACRRGTWPAGTPAPVRGRVQAFEPILLHIRWQTASSVQSQNRPMFLYAVSPSNCWPPVLLVSALLCCASAMTASPMPSGWHRSLRKRATSPVKYLVGVRGEAALDPLALWAYQRTVARMLGNSSHLP